MTLNRSPKLKHPVSEGDGSDVVDSRDEQPPAMIFHQKLPSLSQEENPVSGGSSEIIGKDFSPVASGVRGSEGGSPNPLVLPSTPLISNMGRSSQSDAQLLEGRAELPEPSPETPSQIPASPHQNGSSMKRKRRTVATPKHTANRVGVESNVRRLVEYFVVVSSVRRKRRPAIGKTDTYGEESSAAATPPIASKNSKRGLSNGGHLFGTASPKVQQRISKRKIHLEPERMDRLALPDLESEENSKTLSPGSGRVIRLPVTRPKFSPSQSDDEDSNDEDQERDDGSSSVLADEESVDEGLRLADSVLITKIPKMPARTGRDPNAGKHNPGLSAHTPPIRSKQKRKNRWMRTGGAARSIQMPSEDADVRRYQGSHHGNEDGEVGIELAFEPVVTSRFPLEDYPDSRLNHIAIAQFCNPSSDTIELTTEFRMPYIHHFVLTNERGRKVYGTCLTIYEEYEPPQDGEDLLPEEREILDWYRKNAGTIQEASDGGVGIEVALHRNEGKAALYLPRTLCLLSTWPYLTAFREYLTQLYRLATSTNLMTAPLERYILNICKEIPAPPPGSFEIRLSILDSTIRFWAPPANQPIAYVALPFQTLFECLDVNNILFVWYCLTLERKILLVSSQCSLLTVCSEILCSLLFPMKWSHLYIPTLPRFLSPMLDAPMPYLCGITRENFAYAVGDVGDETIVVDLDTNTITTGAMTPQLPPIPYRRRYKLEKALKKNASEVFWNARGLTLGQINKARNSRKTGAKETLEKILDGAEKAWALRLKGFDDAFNLAYTPDSLDHSLGNDIPQFHSFEEDSDYEQSQWDAVQEAFLRFYVSILRGYRRFLTVASVTGPEEVGVSPSTGGLSGRPTFDSDEFVATRREDFQPFLREFVLTQEFADFLTKPMYSPGEPDIVFFDESIEEKKNRSKLKLVKTETVFLQSAKAHKVLKTIHAVKPNENDLPQEECASEWPLSKVSAVENYPCTIEDGRRTYSYSSWPEKLKKELYGTARSTPDIITSEFDRQASIVAKIRSKQISVNEEDVRKWNLYGSECDPNPEVATFTIFYLLYAAAIGKELVALEERRTELNLDRSVYDVPPSFEKVVEVNKVPKPADGTRDGQNGGVAVEEEAWPHLAPDLMSYFCCSVSDVSVQDLLTAFVSQLRQEDNDIKVEESNAEPTEEVQYEHTEPTEEVQYEPKKRERFENASIFAVELEEARFMTQSQLQLAFETLSMMDERNLYPDPDVYKYLMEACGRCGDAERATELMCIVEDQGLVADSEMYSCFVNAFATNSGASHLQSGLNAPSKIPLLLPYSAMQNPSNEKAMEDFIENVNRSLSASPGGNDLQTPSSDIPLGVESNNLESATSKDAFANRTRSRNRNSISTPRKNLVVTVTVAKHIGLGEGILAYLYPSLSIDTNNPCPVCSHSLFEDDVIAGFIPCAFKDYTTGCPKCKHRFVPHITVSCDSAEFEGSQGPSTPLFCEFLSPWVLRQELHNEIRSDEGISAILRPEWRSKADLNSTLWWNLIVFFNRYKLPVTFLLQGSFKNRLITPIEEE